MQLDMIFFSLDQILTVADLTSRLFLKDFLIPPQGICLKFGFRIVCFMDRLFQNIQLVRTTDIGICHVVHLKIVAMLHTLETSLPLATESSHTTYCENITFKDLNLNGNITNFSIGGRSSDFTEGIELTFSGIVINQGTNITIDNVNIHDFGYCGLIAHSANLFTNLNLVLKNLNSRFVVLDLFGLVVQVYMPQVVNLMRMGFIHLLHGMLIRNAY